MNSILKHLVNIALIRAENNNSKLNDELLNVFGMSGKRTRHFYNNLLSFSPMNVLEIGAYSGISTSSLMYQNEGKLVVIDNFSEFGNVKEELLNNIEKYKGKVDITFYEEDCFKIDLKKIATKFEIYIYDAGHTVEDQYNALVYYQDVLEDIFIYIVDDWNYPPTNIGTYKAIIDLNLNILYKKEIYTHHKHNREDNDIDGFWNGMGIFVLQKSKIN